MKVLIRYMGDKGAIGQQVAGRTIGRLQGGCAVDIHGVVFARFKRIKVDAGRTGKWQEIEFTIEEEEIHKKP